jgi:hypothetical protein
MKGNYTLSNPNLLSHGCFFDVMGSVFKHLKGKSPKGTILCGLKSCYTSHKTKASRPQRCKLISRAASKGDSLRVLVSSILHPEGGEQSAPPARYSGGLLMMESTILWSLGLVLIFVALGPVRGKGRSHHQRWQ